jgi:hypothetical protein
MEPAAWPAIVEQATDYPSWGERDRSAALDPRTPGEPPRERSKANGGLGSYGPRSCRAIALAARRGGMSALCANAGPGVRQP